MANSTLLTNVGRAIASGRVAGIGSGIGANPPNYLALGTNATATAAVTDTALATEEAVATWAGYARPLGTASQITTTVTDDTYQLTGTFTNPAAGTTQAITEVGSFDASVSGNIFIHSTFAVINIPPGGSLAPTLTWQLT